MANVAGKVEVGGHFHIFIRNGFLSFGEIVKGCSFLYVLMCSSPIQPSLEVKQKAQYEVKT